VHTISEAKFPTENILEFPLREGGRQNKKPKKFTKKIA